MLPGVTQVFAEGVLCRGQFAVGEKASRLNNLGRQPFQIGDLLGRLRRILDLSRHAIQAFEHTPARRERRVEVHTPQEGIDRTRGIPQGRVAIATLLIQEAEPRIRFLQAAQRCQRVGYSAQTTLIGGYQVQRITVLGHCNRKRFGRGERIAVPAALA
jgi:hypothetical protein